MNWSSLSYLDQMRFCQGFSRMRDVFHALAARDRQKALQYLNDGRLQFPSLFILMPEIEAFNLFDYLNARNKTALNLCVKKINKQNSAIHLDPLSSQDSNTTHQVLKWMFHSGIHWEGPKEDYDAYDAVMDAAAELLIGIYEDKTILPAVAALIFKRNRNGLFIHDLVWSFFQSYDPNSLLLIAEFLLSDNFQDVELACKLLHLQLPQGMGRVEATQKLYREYRAWLRENSPFLYFTREHFQFTSDPNPLRSDLEAIYLYREISPKTKKPIDPLTEDEMACLNGFRECAEEEQALLAAYSRKLHNREKRSWDKWIHTQLAQQVSTAKSRSEVV